KEGDIDHAISHVQIRVGNTGPLEERLFHKAAYFMKYFFIAHAFTDGNKRTGYIIALLFLAMNNHPPSIMAADYQKHVNFFKSIASRRMEDKDILPEILNWFKENS
ncbi:MAG: Fic family protein, partial [Nanoarchaeota archaeon]